MVNLKIAIERKSYAKNMPDVLGPLAFNVSQGEFVSLVGPSGTGKSTLLNMIAGLEPIQDGSIRFNDQLLAGSPPCKLSYIFQQPRLMPWLTVADNLRLVMPDSAPFEIEKMLDKVGLKGKSDCYPKQLSGGMQRRVSIARAFLTRPDVLLLDEPFISLDAPNAHRLRSLLVELWLEHKTTVVFVTHDLNEAIQLSDRIIFLSSSPGTVLLDKEVDLPRPRADEDIHFQNWKKHLLSQNPGLLEGQADGIEYESFSGGFI
ncbi:ABC transporter ATP-binding protein [Neptuniibacter sp. 2_MG-2023]|uniref:ABC transporter ATP-binding protein n=1 Tax=Neptuniibacter sp. 2_MG-2023 TaxID=3062671 RepID=UPI0026E371E8|nr:ABC transporter ATP-binding protein [Neptuniibacter sp. 2_MG-2023]MDO6515393.1 ABC transporter ATP-binding protein [Neptuniibacter sp. 2_MG-2023]